MRKKPTYRFHLKSESVEREPVENYTIANGRYGAHFLREKILTKTLLGQK